MSEIGSFMTSAISPDIFEEIKEIFENAPDIFEVKTIPIGGRKDYGFICGKISCMDTESTHLRDKTFKYINQVLSRGPNDRIIISVHNEDGSTVVYRLEYNYLHAVVIYEDETIDVHRF